MSVSKNKWRLLLPLAILVVGVSVWQIVKYRIVREKLPVWTARKTNGLYRISYGRLHLDEVAGSMVIEDLKILPDTQVYAGMVQQHNAPPQLVKAKIPRLTILGVKTPKALLTRRMEARTIEISDATVELLVGREHKEKKANDPLEAIETALLSKVSGIRIDSIRLVRTSLSIRKMQDREPGLRLDSLSVDLTQFVVDSLQARDSSRILFSKTLKVHCDGFRIASGSKKYDLLVDGLDYTSAGDVLSARRLRWRPRLLEAAFAASFPVATDRYDFSLRDVRFLHLERAGLLENQIFADSLVVARSAFKVYCDVSYPHNMASKRGKFPQQLVMKLPFSFGIHKALFTNTYIEYKEKNAKSDSAGRLRFFDGTAVVANLTNEKEWLSRDDRCSLRYKGKFLDRTPMEIRLDLVLADPDAAFHAEGKLDSLDAPAINPVIAPMGLIKVEKGAIQNFQFSVRGNDSACSGRLTLAYKGASVAFVKWKGDRYTKKILPSLVMAGVMRHSNPTGNGLPRTVPIGSKWKERDSFISYVWKTVLDGIKRTVEVK